MISNATLFTGADLAPRCFASFWRLLFCSNQRSKPCGRSLKHINPRFLLPKHCTTTTHAGGCLAKKLVGQGVQGLHLGAPCAHDDAAGGQVVGALERLRRVSADAKLFERVGGRRMWRQRLKEWSGEKEDVAAYLPLLGVGLHFLGLCIVVTATSKMALKRRRPEKDIRRNRTYTHTKLRRKT